MTAYEQLTFNVISESEPASARPSEKRCSMCGKVKPLEEFHQHRKRRDGRVSRCRVCMALTGPEARRRFRERHSERMVAAQAQWRESNPERVREYNRKQYAALRSTVFDHYGWTCACCGSADRPTIDHVYGGGRRHRKQIGTTGASMFYRWLAKNNFPAEYQTLCGPCNYSKGATSACRLNHETAA